MGKIDLSPNERREAIILIMLKDRLRRAMYPPSGELGERPKIRAHRVKMRVIWPSLQAIEAVSFCLGVGSVFSEFTIPEAV